MTLSEEQVATSKAIQQRTGKTFHFATRFLPERIRYPTYVLYAFFRIADDVVDTTADVDPAEQRERLAAIREQALGRAPPEDPVLEAFADLRERHDIPDREIDLFVDSMAMDVDTNRYRTHEELADYLRGSAAAVGQMMLEVMDPPEKAAARPHASALGDALQLTNFLRDVREDVLDLDRIYLPAEALAEHGASHDDIEALEFSQELAAAIEAELQRAERWYHEGVSGIASLPEDTQFAVLAAAVMYADYHRQIRAMGYDVLTQEPSLTVPRRIALLARTWLAWRGSRDPVAVFYRVTDLEPPADVAGEAGRDREGVQGRTTDVDGASERDRANPTQSGILAFTRRSLQRTGDVLRLGPIRDLI